MDNTYGGRHVSPSEAGTQAAQEIARREAAEQARRNRELAEAAARNRQLEAQMESSRREAAQHHREEQRRAQQKRDQKARVAAANKQNARATQSPRKMAVDKNAGSAMQKLITVVAVFAAAGWAWPHVDGDGRLWTVGITAVVAGALAWALYKVIVALIVLVILGLIAIFAIAHFGGDSDLASADLSSTEFMAILVNS